MALSDNNWLSIAFLLGLAYLVIRGSRKSSRERSLIYSKPWSGAIPSKKENFSDRVFDLEVDTDE